MLLPDDYLTKKFARLLFEIMEYPSKRETLYLALCYCQLSDATGREVPLTALDKCLRRYRVDPENYPWRDFAAEFEIFAVKEGGRELCGAELMAGRVAAENSVLTLSQAHAHLRRIFCRKITAYWRFLVAFGSWNPPRRRRGY